MTLKARVTAERFVLDEATDLPERPRSSCCPWIPAIGSMKKAEALQQALTDSAEDVKAGRLVDADVILRELRSR